MIGDLLYSRLNISSASEATPRRRGTPLRGTPSKKRKRMSTLAGEGMSSSKIGYISTSTSKGPIEVFETDEDGKFIKLLNTSEKVRVTLLQYVVTSNIVICNINRYLLLSNDLIEILK